MKKILLLITLMICLGCSHKQENQDIQCSCPHVTICLQPLDNFTKKEALSLVPVLEDKFGYWIYGEWKFKVLDPKPLPKDAFVASRNRYRTTPILNMGKKLLTSDEIIIGLTHKDICADVHNIKNYGIMGMSYLGGQVCIVSDKRLKNKSYYWKLILHEFMHTFYKAPHCPKDDPTCIMKDAKGHGNLKIQNKLCGSCKQ